MTRYFISLVDIQGAITSEYVNSVLCCPQVAKNPATCLYSCLSYRLTNNLVNDTFNLDSTNFNSNPTHCAPYRSHKQTFMTVLLTPLCSCRARAKRLASKHGAVPFVKS